MATLLDFKLSVSDFLPFCARENPHLCCAQRAVCAELAGEITASHRLNLNHLCPHMGELMAPQKGQREPH